MNIRQRFDRLRAQFGLTSAAYEELSKATSRCTFSTPTRGDREHVVNISVDEIEDLILTESERRKQATK